MDLVHCGILGKERADEHAKEPHTVPSTPELQRVKTLLK